MSTIYVSSPGKVILHGEHAVVYGKRALAASLNIRTFMKLDRTDDGKINIELPDIDLSRSWDVLKLEQSLHLPQGDVNNPTKPSDEVLQQLRQIANIESDTETRNLAIISFLYLFTSISQKLGKLPSSSIYVKSNLPPSAGLGSSAAYSACLAAGLLELAGAIKEPEQGVYSQKDKELINKWAFESERVIHGNPSGIDNSVCTYGGAISFQAGQITHLDSVPKIDILLTNTKIPRSTKVLVAGVRAKYNKYPNIIKPVLDSVEAICIKCEELFQEMQLGTTQDHFQSLKDLIEMNQLQLSLLGVSHPTLDKICNLTAKCGMASKLTGAGGGGCAFTIINSSSAQIGDTQNSEAVQEIMDTLIAEGFDCWKTDIGGPGVTRHHSLDL